jgi:hypothetical protein
MSEQEAHSASAEMRAAAVRLNVAELRQQASDRSRGYMPIDDWGPACVGCGQDEFCIDGYCSVECRDYHDEELAPAVLELLRALELLRSVRRRLTFDEGLIDIFVDVDELLRRFDFEERAPGAGASKPGVESGGTT